MNYKLLIFDLDGTLIDSLEDLTVSLNYALTRCGIPKVTLENTKIWVGKGLARLLELSLGHQASDERLIENIKNLFIEHYTHNLICATRCYPGIDKILNSIDENRKMAVLSNKHTQFILPILQKLEIDRYFSIFLGGDNPYGKKPSGNGVLKIMELCNMPHDSTLLIGDMPVDIETAQFAGVSSCAALWGYGSEDELKQMNPDFIVRTPDELFALLHDNL